jgi:hypothetical protein
MFAYNKAEESALKSSSAGYILSLSKFGGILKACAR